MRVLEQAVAALVAEREKLDRAITALRAAMSVTSNSGRPVSLDTKAPAGRKAKGIKSMATRKRISRAMKKMFREKRAVAASRKR